MELTPLILILLFSPHLICATEGSELNETDCQAFIEQKKCVWNATKNKLISIGQKNSCIFNCTYHPNITHGPVRLNVYLRSSWVDSHVFISVQQAKDAHSWTLPTFFHALGKDQPYTTLEKVFCPDNAEEESLFFRITSRENNSIVIDLKPTPNILSLGDSITTVSSPVSPTVLLYMWQKNEESVLILAKSGSLKTKNVCALLSLQNAKCPYNEDRESIIGGGGKYQSFLDKGGMVGKRTQFPDGIHIVVLPLPSNDICYKAGELGEKSKHVKSVNITVHFHATFDENWGAFSGIGFFIAALVVLIVTCATRSLGKHIGIRGDRDQRLINENAGRQLRFSVITEVVNYEEVVPTEDDEEEEQLSLPNSPDVLSVIRPHSAEVVERADREDVRNDEQNIDSLYNPSNVFWWRSLEVFRSHAKEEPNDVGFEKNLVLLGVFMALPFAELLKSYLKIFAQHGTEDQCYFNSRCLTSWGIFNDVSGVFSNLGFLSCGFGFLFVVRRHRLITESTVARLPNGCVVGVSRQYGLFRSLGYALLIQCVMSSMYHICPNEVTLRFDMLFIYVTSILVVVGLWGLRHGNVSEHLYSSVGLVGLGLVTAEVQEWTSPVLFWFFFASIQMFVTFTTTYSMIQYGCWSFSPFAMFKMVKRWKPIVAKMRTLLNDVDMISKPVLYLKAVLGIGVNIVLVSIGAALNVDIYKYILLVCLTHMVIYLLNYMISKKFHKESSTPLGWSMLFLSMALWIVSLAFFLLRETDSQDSPSSSRELNSECVLFGILSYHDLWHIFSSFALLTTFIGILILDDDLALLPSEKIPVF